MLEHAAALFTLFGIAKHADEFPSRCSGGQRQKAALIRALLTPAEIIALDEPAGAIDQITRVSIYEALLSIMQQRAMEAQHLTVLIVSHDPEELLLLCDEIVVFPPQPLQPPTVFPVPLARPRLPQLRFTQEFLALKQSLWTRLL